MKYMYALIAAVLITVLCFCTGEKETKANSLSANTVKKCLSEKAIFVMDSVQLAFDFATNSQKDESRKYFLKAMDLLVNKQKAKESIPLFREAIRYYPDTRAYYFLATAYLTLHDAEHAKEANDICIGQWYDPMYEAYFNEALIYALRKDSSSCMDALLAAVNEGFLDKSRIINEKRFEFIREMPAYVSMIVNTFNDDDKLRALLFKNYLKAFPDLALPYTEVIDSVRNHNYAYINYTYAPFIPHMEDGRFSRDVTNEYFAVGKVKTGNTYAMVYKTYLAIADTLNPVKTFIVTYDSIGKVADQEMIGCFCSPTESQAFTINSDFTVNQLGYTFKWKQDPVEKGYAGNEILSAEVQKPVQIQLQEGGVISREKIAGKAEASGNSGG